MGLSLFNYNHYNHFGRFVMVKVSRSCGGITLRSVQWRYFELLQNGHDVLKTPPRLKMTEMKHKLITPKFLTDV